ncbi:hypothetical protein LMED105_00160 [Limnobacter sp. MED105]|nr:hypothetical protein LMED105_00160 [Limnobacter sp. MED105]
MGRPRGADTIRYVFRLSESAKKKMDKVAPPSARARSPFIREALDEFVALKEKRNLSDRPHMTGRPTTYIQVCATLQPEIVDAIKAVYPDTSVSVVIQAAVIHALENK